MAVSLSISLAGCHSAPALSPEEVAGKHLFTVRCAHCHEDKDLALKKVPPNLRAIFERKTLPSGAPATDTEVRRVILTGEGKMPAFNGRFTEEQMSDLLVYMKTGLR
jgi:mono/diheme cytochrome c family protein